jgi:hypothetical protein
MLLLRDLGLPATNRQARKACKLLLDEGLERDGGINNRARWLAHVASRKARERAASSCAWGPS